MYRLAGQEMNVKKLCRKENIANPEKTMVDFVSVLSSIQLFFLSGSAPSDVRWRPRLTLSSLLDTTRALLCLWLTPSVVNLVTLHSAVRLEHHRIGQDPSWNGGCYFHSGCCYQEGSDLPEQHGCCSTVDDSAPGSRQLLSRSVLAPKLLSP